MPSDALINDLEQLRETYTQRQRATNGLMTALKGATGAVGKANRSLRDYTDQAPSATNGALAQAKATLGTLRLKDDIVDPLLPELRREVKTVSSLASALKDALSALRAESVDVVRLGRAYQLLRGSAGAVGDDDLLARVVPQVDQEVQQAQNALATTFGRALVHAAADQGITVQGRPPTFEIGRFKIETNFANRGASISYGQEEVTKKVALSVEAVLKAYQRDAKSITGRNEDGARWIEQFHTAYQNVRRRREISGSRVNIVDCFLEMLMLRQSKAFRIAPGKATLTEYTRAQFAYDLVEFTNVRRLAYGGKFVAVHGATKSHTDNPERSIFIVEGDAHYHGRYIGDLEFS